MMKQLLATLTQKWFLLLSLFLLAFIVLFPKLPLFDLIPGYIVRVRIEDFLLLFVLLIYGIQLLRGKATLKSPITGILVFYSVVGVLSILNAAFVIKSVPFNMLHIGKMILHFLRRLEYFSIFFLFFTAVKKKSDLKWVFGGLSLMLIGITLYGYGQKYLYWPVYSTMNREFSKGVRLVLTEHARVPSTFGGHYDMSAFTMFTLTLILALFFYTKNKMVKAGLVLTYAAGFWLLILGSSRSSFLAYIVAVGTLILLIAVHKRSFVWALTRGAVVLGASMLVMLSFGDLSSRFTQLGVIKQVNERFSALLKPAVNKPSGSIEVDPLDKTDQRPVPIIKGSSPVIGMASPAPTATASALPPDVYANIPDLKVITATVGGKTVTTVIEVQREFSPCTYKYGLSACIRFDTLWPRAIWGARRSPLLGSGFSTLTKGAVDEFTEAESTDNDFLRNLGESGILGVIGFYGPIIIFMMAAVRKLSEEQSPLVIALMMGVLAGTLGMFFNALYIDVFEASKVAFTYWSILGAGFASMSLPNKAKRKA
jgi:hypothetical protein